MPSPSIDQFRAIAELQGDIAFIIDCGTGQPTYLSPSAGVVLGAGIADFAACLAGKHPASPLAALCAGLPERLRRFAAGDLSRQRVVREFDLALAERTLPVEVITSILTDDAGVPASVVGLVRDISAVRERAAQQRKFTSMINHEFRTPLSTIDGAIQRLEATSGNADEPTRQRYRKIGAAVDRLIGMMDDYLSPDRMAAAGAAKPADRASPAALLEEAAGLARAAGREVALQVGDVPASLRCQPGGLRLALKVLVDNALQYGPASAPLQLSAMRADNGIVLLVRDAGSGVPPAEMGRIFDKGYRGSNALGAGSGLGLYMAKSVVEVHGGNLLVQNVAPLGAEFRIWLPVHGQDVKSVASEVINGDNSAHKTQG